MASPATAVRVRLKWFNAEKGFGFVTPLDGRPEAFLHATVLPRGGTSQLVEGTELLCEIACGAKGPQVLRITELSAPPTQPEPVPQMPGVVKWYQPGKGFGFITAQDGGRDVFVHRSALKRSNLDGLVAGQAVLMAVIETVKGREVRGLRLV
ncbi:MAG: cold shock domain-containing protein [Rhodospirillaceae bacterium]|nr:cold shock domain-containing protein [Rhodospirillales bacterium]